MHHVVLDRWSRGESYFHRRDARAKLVSILVVLVAIATAGPPFWPFAVAVLAMLLGLALAAGLPLGSVLARAAIVLPFTAVFALISWAAGDAWRAALLVGKSYLSAVAVLFLAGTTPMPALLRGLEQLYAPRFLLLVTQFLYRYLFVLSEEAQHMRIAAASRGTRRLSQARRAASGAIAVLFAKSYERAEAIHRAMLARGFDGRLHTLDPVRFGAADVVFATALSLFAIAARGLRL
jgi:cobalt/nickel transport system permease protein